jgi:hypothetical protein
VISSVGSGAFKCRCIPTLQRRANRLAVEPAIQIGGSIDVTSSVTGGGEVNLALGGPGSAAISMSSREGTNKPQLDCRARRRAAAPATYSTLAL